ncbi:SLC36A [Mytilus coruscus]|uniref:SLC36A n=1 Tax=Mytilus coruscus TaxID=42192 RepID=A0A6J7ZST6_MYTCO|nr:SLC36A [Mytilus coruscus]
MVKAFIGSNYLAVSFAFYQSGLGLGIIGLLFVATLTDHCCHLIVKTKYRAIRKTINDVKVQSKPNKQYMATSDSEEFSEPDIEIEYDEVLEHEEHMKRHMSYGDVGWNAFGKSGLYVVNFFIAITQFGFCVGYFIFIGNTIQSLFPYIYCDKTMPFNSTVSAYPICHGVIAHKSAVNSSDLYLHHNRHVRQLLDQDMKHFESNTSVIPFTTGNSTTFVPVTSATVSNVSSVIPTISTESTTRPTTSTVTTTNSSTTKPTTSPVTTTNSSTTKPTTSTATTTNSSITTTLPTTTRNISEISSIVQQSSAPSLKFLVASPLPLFILFAMIRTIRKMSFISVLANISIFTGCIAVFIFLVIDFEVHPDIRYFNWEGFPVFFGQLTAAFEGIGLVIPVESSMEGNRHNFASFLHGAICVLSVILGSFGILGYLRFGSEVEQMLNLNIPSASWVAFSINICVIVGVALTFPLQIYPVTEMIELVLFSHGSICGPKNGRDPDDSTEEMLLPKDSPDLVKLIPKEVSAWKRNLVRFLVVCVSAGLAVIFRDSFAYVGAFTGAIGSSLLAYILPCLFHLKICGKDSSYMIIIKDVTIVIIGVICSIVSLYAVIVKLIHQTSV